MKKTTPTEIDYSTFIHAETPKLTRTTEHGIYYNGVLEAVQKSNEKSLRIDIPSDLSPKGAYYGLVARIKGSTYETMGFKVHMADSKVFIVKEQKPE